MARLNHALLAELVGKTPIEEQIRAALAPAYKRIGQVTAVNGLIIKVQGLNAPVGTLCKILSGPQSYCQVVAFDGSLSLLMLLTGQTMPSPSDKIMALGNVDSLPCGDALLGKTLNPLGESLDGAPAPKWSHMPASAPASGNPLENARICEALDVGVRPINALLSVGKGQRVGIFAGSGVGKSTLLAMMARHTSASRVVVGLIGERAREVKEFIEDALGPHGMAKSVVVAASADSSALMKMQGAEYAASLACHFRDSGHDCLLIMDSLTRYAMAAREVGLAVGESPATKGYPPSAFSKIASLVEKAGPGKIGQGGSVTGFYTVLSEGDDLQDPVADSARAILDGHIVLSRSLADQGQYPPIDVNASVSRVFSQIAPSRQQQKARKLRSLLAAFERNRDLFAIGAYARGSDPAADEALDKKAAIDAFLSQSVDEKATWQASSQALEHLV